jgi:hypothetical protein
MVRSRTPEGFFSQVLRADVDVRCSLTRARAGLTEDAARCFPGIPASAPRTNGARVRQELDLPLLGRRTQTVVISSDVSGRANGATRVAFSVRGELLSVSGAWTLNRGTPRASAALTANYTASGVLIAEAVDELRRRSPLPIRTDADAILIRAVEGFLAEHFARQLASYQRRVSELLGARA